MILLDLFLPNSNKCQNLIYPPLAIEKWLFSTWKTKLWSHLTVHSILGSLCNVIANTYQNLQVLTRHDH